MVCLRYAQAGINPVHLPKAELQVIEILSSEFNAVLSGTGNNSLRKWCLKVVSTTIAHIPTLNMFYCDATFLALEPWSEP